MCNAIDSCLNWNLWHGKSDREFDTFMAREISKGNIKRHRRSVVWILFHGSFGVHSSSKNRVSRNTKCQRVCCFESFNRFWRIKFSVNMNSKLKPQLPPPTKLRLFAVIWRKESESDWKTLRTKYARITLAHPIKYFYELESLPQPRRPSCV